MQTFVEVGQALMEIRDARLYRETHATFESYLDERWGMSRANGYRMIDAAKVAELVSPMGDIQNERQARELVPLLREDEQAVVEVWRDLRDEHGDALTAEKLKIAVDERLRREKLIGTLTSSDTFEWYTPARYVEAAREVLGAIDLDPASSARANATVRATRYFDLEADGLSQPWAGRVWLNPPYGRNLSGAFVAKAIEEYEADRVAAMILLLNGYGFDSSWFRPLWRGTLCFTDHRIPFESPIRDGSGGASFGSVFVYLGPDDERFARVFQSFGTVLVRHPMTAGTA